MILAMPQATKEMKAAFEELFRELYRPVCAIFTKKGCSLEDAQDLASETFARAFKSFGQFRGDAKPLTWLHTIAANVWLNRIRDAAAAKRDGIEVSIPEDGHSDLISQDRPHDQALKDERRRLLRSAIEELPPRMRRCVLLRVYQDMKYRDIAKILNVNIATAKSQFSLARPRLRSQLADHYPELDDDPGD